MYMQRGAVLIAPALYYCTEMVTQRVFMHWQSIHGANYTLAVVVNDVCDLARLPVRLQRIEFALPFFIE
jgi:hypothetical protein